MDLSSGIFSTLCALLRQELWKKCGTSIQGVRVSSWQVSVLLLSWEPKTVMVILRGHVWPYKIQKLYQITATEESKIQDKATWQYASTDHRTFAVQCKLKGEGIGVRWKTPAGNLQNGYQQMVSKSIKTFQKTLKTARLGRCTRQDLQAPTELPCTTKVCPKLQDTTPSPLKTLRFYRDSEDVQATAGTACPGQGPAI